MSEHITSQTPEGVNIQIRLTPLLRRLFPAELFVESRQIAVADVRNLGEALCNLSQLCADSASQAELSRRLYEENAADQLGRYVNVYIDDEDARYVGGLAAVLAEGQEISIQVAISGG